MARKNRAGGTGRSTQLRSFTLHLTLPIPAPAPAPASISPPLANSVSSFEPHFINAGTPVAGVPEWLPRGALISRSKTPSVQSLRAPPLPASLAQTPGLQFTPMEGVPERCYPRAQTALRLALLAQYPAAQQEQELEEVLVIHKANDDILLPDVALDQEEEEREEEGEASASISCHPMVTPFGRHREIDIQVGQSLGKERVPRPLVSLLMALPSEKKDTTQEPPITFPQLRTSNAAPLILKTPAAPPKDSNQLVPPPQYDDDDDNGDMPGYFDDAPCSDDHDHDHAAHRDAEEIIQPAAAPEPSSAAVPSGPGPSSKGVRGRKAGTSNKRPREVLKKETESDRRARKSLADDGLKFDESDGMRRSSRAHQRPLEYWRNEHKVFGRDHQTLPTVTRYETRTPNPSWPLSNKGKEGKKRARTRG